MNIKNLFKRHKKNGTELKANQLEMTFTDMEGINYYRFPDFMAFPLERHARRAQITQWMASGLTNDELEKLIGIAETELENLVAGKKGSLSKVGAVLNQIKMRKELVLHHELVYQYIAVHYIRDDENPYQVDDMVMDAKIESFKRMVAGGRLLDFFQLKELNRINETIGLSSDEFQELWNASIVEQKILLQKIKFLISKLKSEIATKTTTAAL